MQAQRQSRGLRGKVDGSCREPLIREPLSRNSVHERVEALERMPSDVPLIQAERKLVNVASKMLLADLVIDAMQSALEDRPDALNAIRAGHSANGSLAHGAASEVLLVGFVLVNFQTADERLVNLNRAAKFVQVFAARFAETVKDKPRGFLSDADFLGQLHRRDALASRHEQVHRIEPFVKRNMGPLKDSSCPHGEVQFAGVAAVVAILADGDSLYALALRASDAVRPETGFEVRSRAGFIGKHLEEFEGANC
jgi:hypothetical protein